MSIVVNDLLGENAISSLQGSVYHTEPWRHLIQNTYGYSSNYLNETTGGNLTGLLPMFYINSFVRGRHLSCVPFSHQVEPLYNNENVLSKLVAQAKELSLINKCKFIEIRGGGEVLTNYGFKESTNNWISLLPLTLSDSDLWAGISSSTKRNIRRASNSGLRVERKTELSDYYDFSRLVLITRRYQGSLPYPSKLYEELADNPYSRLYCCYQDGILLAGIVILVFSNKVIYAYGASTKNQKLLQLRPNDYLFWTVINQVREEGYETFDFGTTPVNNLDLLRFKENWGAKSQKLSYEYMLVTEKDLPIIKRNSRSMKIIKSIIQKSPLSILKIFGPLLLREIG